MTTRSGPSRQTNSTNATVSSRQLNNRSGAAAVKAADIEKFNAAMKAKEDGGKASQESKRENLKQTEDTPVSQTMHAGAALASQGNLSAAHMSPNQTFENGISAESEAHAGGSRSAVSLSMAIQKHTTSPVEQAATIIQRIIDSTNRNREAKSWKLELLLDDDESLTIQLEYLGKTDWSIGLLDDNEGKGSGLDDGSLDEQGFVEELKITLNRKNPELRLSSASATGIS